MKYNELVEKVNEILGQYDRATVRQIYYRLVSPPYQYMANTISMYSSFDQMLVKAREQDDVDWRRIIDTTRQTIRPENAPYSSVETFIDNFKYNISNWWERYTSDMWANQETNLRVFVEKDALAQIMASVALPYQIAVVPGRGYNSLTQLMEQGDELTGTTILYFGDFDPSGLDIDRSIEDRLSSYGADFELVRVALTEDDIADLPPNPTKHTDKRAGSYVAQYGDRCWELDALPPDQLKDKIREAIEGYIDHEVWDRDLQTQEDERQQIKKRLANIKL